jgi:predicted transcriptional regulator
VPRDVKKTADDGTVATSVRLPARLRARLQAIADEERRTLGNVIRIAIEDWLAMRDVKKGAGK